MTSRKIIFIILISFFFVASKSQAAPNCTIDGDGNSGNGITPFTSAQSLATIQAAINSAPDGAVVCLRRGSTWSKTDGVGISFTRGHSNTSRVTVCSSDNTQCLDGTAAGANARITMTDSGADTSGVNCMAFSSGANGYTIKNIDCFGINKCDLADSGDGEGVLGGMPTGLKDITFEGGVYDGFQKLAYLGFGVGVEPPTNIKFGTCANRTEIRNCGVGGNPRWTWYGACKNCGFSTYIHNYGPPENTGGQGHIIDFITNNTNDAVESSNVTIECNQWDFGPGHVGGGDVIRLSDGANVTIRNNVFRRLTTTNDYAGVSGIGFQPHSPGVGFSIWDGAEIYGNTFDFGWGHSFTTQTGRNVRFYNNVIVAHDRDASNYHGESSTLVNIQPHNSANTNAGANVVVNNNTFAFFHDPVGPECCFGSDQPASALIQLCGGPNCGTGNKFYNNVLQDDRLAGQGLGAMLLSVGDCNNYGSNGANIKNNFYYTPNDSTPALTNCSGATGNSTVSNINPGFANPAANFFSLLSTSQLIGKGTSVFGVLSFDFANRSRPNPPSIGAFDVGTGAPPPPPTKLSTPGLPLILK